MNHTEPAPPPHGRAPTARLRGLVALLRPKQWIKNGFVLAPLIFTGEFTNSTSTWQTLLAAALFCLASSAVYIVNDLQDIESDRQHPKKSKTRPLASGAVTVPLAISMLIALYAALCAAWFIAPAVIQVIVAYIVLNLAYTFSLKHQPVLDIFSVAAGFVLRVYAGAMALSVPMSSWMFVTTLCLALFLAAIKRRQELLQSGSDGRKVLTRYSAQLVDRYAEMAATGTLVFYSLSVMTTHPLAASPALVLTVPIVLFGLFRYWYVVDVLEGGESPTDALLSDWQLLAAVALWATVCIWAMWPAQG